MNNTLKMAINFDDVPHEEGETLRFIKCLKMEVGSMYYCENDCSYYWVLEDESEVTE